VASYAAFWSARYGLTMGVQAGTDGIDVSLAASGRVPAQTLVSPFPLAAAVLKPSGLHLQVSADGRRVTVPAFASTAEVVLQVAGSGE
jgi:hypothetical protein